MQNKKKNTVINKIGIIMLGICLIVAGLVVILTIAKTEIKSIAKTGDNIKTNYAEETTNINTWDISATENDNVTATLSDDGTLTISGTGKMKDWDFNSSTEWHGMKTLVKTVVIESGVLNIGQWAFDSCESLVNIEIPDGVTSIGYSAFYSCTSLTSIEIPASVITIGSCAFKQCTNLTSMEILGGLTDIKDEMFYGCTCLTNITIPNSVTSIGSYAFYYCRSLKNLEIPETVTSIGVNAFGNSIISKSISPELNQIELPTLLKRTQDKTDILYSSKEFDLTNCTIKDGIISINNGASYARVYIKDGALNGLWYTINISNNLWDVSELNDGSVKATLSDDGVLTISGTGKMKDWTSSSSTEWHGVKNQVKAVVIENGVTNIGTYAFWSCSNLKNIKISNSVTSIGGYAFLSCYNITNIEIPDGVISIEASAFKECGSLTSIEISKSVTTIIKNAFFGCYNLKQIKVDEDNEMYCDEDGVLYTKDKTQIIKYPPKKVGDKYVISNNVISIGDSAFRNCKSLTSIEIPDSVTSIERAAFEWCTNLTEIIIPSSVTSIGGEAFRECNNLIIICRSGSTAEAYAKENNIKYVLIMDRIKPNTKVGELKKNLQSETEYEIFDKIGNKVSDEVIIGTDYKVKMVDGREYIIIVWGDFTGDGKIGIAELARASRTAVQLQKISWKEKLILDVSGNGKIEVTDLAALSRFAVQ